MKSGVSADKQCLLCVIDSVTDVTLALPHLSLNGQRGTQKSKELFFQISYQLPQWHSYFDLCSFRPLVFIQYSFLFLIHSQSLIPLTLKSPIYLPSYGIKLFYHFIHNNRFPCS